jgi:hypothetical protein
MHQRYCSLGNYCSVLASFSFTVSRHPFPREDRPWYQILEASMLIASIKKLSKKTVSWNYIKKSILLLLLSYTLCVQESCYYRLAVGPSPKFHLELLFWIGPLSFAFWLHRLHILSCARSDATPSVPKRMQLWNNIMFYYITFDQL